MVASLPAAIGAGGGCAGCSCGGLTFILPAIPCSLHSGSLRTWTFRHSVWQTPRPNLLSLHCCPFGPPWRSSLCTMSPFLPQSRSQRSQSPPPSREVEVANLGPLKTESDGEEVCLPLGSKVLEPALAVTRSPSLRKCCKLALCDYGSLRTRAGLVTCKEDLGGPRGVPEARPGTSLPPQRPPLELAWIRSSSESL